MANQFERLKSEKDGLAVKAELEAFARMGWENIPEDDRDHRLKWLGIFFRKRTPGQFMLRLRLPNGILTSGQMRMLGAIIHPYGEQGVADITTRQNLQLRGIPIEEMPQILGYLKEVGLTSIQSGMDNVRNITGSPLAGIDPDELIDVRGLTRKVQDMITNNGEGNPSFSNLPRKFNIAICGCRDNSVHAEINDLAFVPAFKNGRLGFNVLVGGFFSARRCAEAIGLDVWVDPRDVVPLCEAVLLVYRDHGLRANRQKARLMWLIDEWGLEKFRAAVERQTGHPLLRAAEKDEVVWHKRDLLGVHAQKQPGLNFVGLHVPVGRLNALEMMELARLAEVYGSGELRLTVEQNVLIPNVPDSRVAPLLKEPLLKKFSPQPRALAAGVGVLYGQPVLQLCPYRDQKPGCGLDGGAGGGAGDPPNGAHPLDGLPQLLRPTPSSRYRPYGHHCSQGRQGGGGRGHLHGGRGGQRRQAGRMRAQRDPLRRPQAGLGGVAQGALWGQAASASVRRPGFCFGNPLAVLLPS